MHVQDACGIMKQKAPTLVPPSVFLDPAIIYSIRHGGYK